MMIMIRIYIAMYKIPLRKCLQYITRPSLEKNRIYSKFIYRTLQTFAHFLKASIGSGVLAMPSAFANAGYVTGPVLTLIIGCIAVHCLHILVSKRVNLKNAFIFIKNCNSKNISENYKIFV